MRPLALVLVAAAASAARAECWDSSSIGAVVGVADDGSFVYRTVDSNEAEGGSGTRVEWVDAGGRTRTTFSLCRGADCERGWKVTGAAPPPSIVAGAPAPDELVARLRAHLGATRELAPSARGVRVVDGDSVHRVRAGRATLYVMRMDEGSEWPVRDWHARLYEAPASPFLFLRLTERAHTHAIADCTEVVDRTVWLPRSRLDPADRSAEVAYCVDSDQPLPCLVAAGADSALAGELLRLARAAGHDRAEVVEAAATLAARTRPDALVQLARRGDGVARAYALEALTRVLAILGAGEAHGPAADALRRAALAAKLGPLCAAAPACREELAKPGPDVAIEELGECRPADGCRSAVLGVAADGGFLVRQDAAEVRFEARAADGALRFRFTGDDGWRVEGQVDARTVALSDDDPDAAALQARLARALGLSPLAPSRLAVRLDGERVMSGDVSLARTPEPHLRTVRAFEHARSPLVFLEVAKPRCPSLPCRVVVWGAKPR